MKQNIKNFIQDLGVLSLSITIAFVAFMGLSVANGWSEPAGIPPGGNVGAPINTGSGTQVKSGALSVGGLFTAGAVDSKGDVCAFDGTGSEKCLSSMASAIPSGYDFVLFGNAGVYLKKDAYIKINEATTSYGTVLSEAKYANTDGTGYKIYTKATIVGICNSGWKLGLEATCSSPNHVIKSKTSTKGLEVYFGWSSDGGNVDPNSSSSINFAYTAIW